VGVHRVDQGAVQIEDQRFGHRSSLLALPGPAADEEVVKRALVVAAILLAGLWAWTRHAQAVNQRALGAVGAQLAGRPVHVHCQSWLGQLVDVGSNAGQVQFDAYGRPAARTDLIRSVCGLLHRFRTSSTHPELDCLLTVDWRRWSFERDSNGPCAQRAMPMAEAINTLTHESMHMHGWADEATAQCYAIQEDAWTTIRLGGTPAEGRAVAGLILALQPGLPREYQSGACGPGGALDLHPETPEFPTEADPAPPPAAR
jgi:hypothetical protein